MRASTRLRIAGACIAAALIVWIRVRSADRGFARILREDLAQQVHACVPLGWNPVPTAADGIYYPGRTLVVHEEGVWFTALWLARVRASRLEDPDVRATVTVLDELVRLGMLQRTRRRTVATYRLTPRAIPYFYAQDDYGNNPSGQPYLCYSRIVPERIAWRRALQSSAASHREPAFRVAFVWNASAAASWARSAVLERHSVLLAPTTNPAIATIVGDGRDRRVVRLWAPGLDLSRVVDVSAWPR